MRSVARILLPTVLLFGLCVVLFQFYNTASPDTLQSIHNKYESSLSKFGGASTPPKDKVTGVLSSGDQKLATRKPRYAIASSVQTASFTAYALMLGYTLQKHNDLIAQDAEMVLLIREEGADAVTAENRTRLEQAGWKIRVAEDLEFDGVDNTKIRAHHRHNLNKLHLWSWTEYEKILFIDADVACKGSVAELWDVPGDFAAAPDVWWNILTDNRFNSGVIVFRPSLEEYPKLIAKVSDPEYHKPNDADQAFLNVYYRFRYFGLPYKYNFNLVMYQFHRKYWDMLWEEAVLVHMTVRKPKPDPKDHCHKGCNEWEPVEWYAMIFKEMLAYYGWEKELPVYG